MKQVHTTKKAQKDYGLCSVCEKPIEKGTTFIWANVKSKDVCRHVECGFTDEELMTREERKSLVAVAQTPAPEAPKTAEAGQAEEQSKPPEVVEVDEETGLTPLKLGETFDDPKLNALFEKIKAGDLVTLDELK